MNRVEMLQASWLPHRRALINLLDAVPADQVNFKPWEGAMSFGELVLHTTQEFFYRLVQTGEANRPPAPEWSTLDDLKAIVKQRTDDTNAIYASLTDADLDKTIEVAAMNMKGPGVMYLGMARDHEIHHKGQLFVYARMMGTKEMPFFIAR